MSRSKTPAKKTWVTPEVRHIVAGSAEAASNKNTADGGSGSSQKS
jgi:hypothetical protein